MSWTAPKNWILGEYLTEADLDEQIRDNLTFLKTNIALETPAELTIDAGEVTKTQSHHSIAAEAGVEDDLETINDGADGEVLLLRAKTGHTIILKHGVDNISNPFSEEDVEITESKIAILSHNGTEWIIYGSGSGSGGISKGISFPESAEAGDLFYRSDLNKYFKCQVDY